MTTKTSTAYATPDEELTPNRRFWWQHLTGYHWLVLLVASGAWFFDCLDQRIFSMARSFALKSLMPPTADFQYYGKVVTAFFLIGWGIGGMTFGALGDKFGRKKMLTISILLYSVFGGLNFFSQTWQQFAAFRFLTGLGIGGVFGLAVALIAETVPAVARTQSLGLLQILSAVGNITASLVLKAMNLLVTHHILTQDNFWRYMFLVGAVPSLIVMFAISTLREPEPWLDLKRKGLLPKGNLFAPYSRLFGEVKWRRNLIVGALIASTGVIGLWGIGEYTPDFQNKVFGAYYEHQLHMNPLQVGAAVKNAISNAFFLNQVGAVIGMWLFTRFALIAGRKPAFLVGFSAAMVVTAFVYWKMKTPADAYWMMPLMGAAQLGVFAGFSIYLPELFPSALRSTGTSFCYNLGRFAAAGGSFFSAYLSQAIGAHLHSTDASLSSRYSAMAMCVIFLIGIAALPFAPETKGKPLP